MPHDTEDMIQLLLRTNKEQEQTIVDLRATIKELRSTIANLNETIDELKRKIFGTSSEKTRRPDPEEGIQADETVTVVKEHTRTRKKSLSVQICMKPFPYKKSPAMFPRKNGSVRTVVPRWNTWDISLSGKNCVSLRQKWKGSITCRKPLCVLYAGRRMKQRS